MHHRRTIALACGVLLLAPLAASCGFDYPTDRVNELTAGATNRTKSVDVLNALVVAAGPGSGTFIATLSNNDDKESAALTSVSGEAGGEPLVVSGARVDLFPGAAANLANEEGIRVIGDFEAGQVLPMAVSFDTGEQVEVDVPVVAACGQYAELDDAPEIEGQVVDVEPYSCEPGGESEDAE